MGSNHGDGDVRYETGGGNVYLALDDSRTFLEELGVVHLNRLDLRREIARGKGDEYGGLAALGSVSIPR